MLNYTEYAVFTCTLVSGSSCLKNRALGGGFRPIFAET